MSAAVRKVDHVSSDTRFVAVAVLDTGKELRWESDWKPSHWDVGGERQSVINGARRDLAALEGKYGVKAPGFQVWQESRRVERFVETRTKQTLDSTHSLDGAK